MPLIVLWDIDHTLIENAGVSKEIYAAAFTTVAGFPPREPAPTEGRTDRLIIAELFRRHDLAVPDWADAQVALAGAAVGREAELRRRGYVLPGALEALKAVAAEPGMVSSVLTGNIVENARVKLAAFGLEALVELEVGGYGSDGEDRAELVRKVRQRIAHRDGRGNVFPIALVGDTPRDVEAGRDAGARVLAVASGRYSVSDLESAGADRAIRDLRDSAEVVEQLREWASE
jgi:phosphoglycolate phosphatase-like HAD superfamily hydrolase